jgi:hypothetical protein
VVWRTDGASVRLDDLQFTLGQGPAVGAAASGELVIEPDLASVPTQRWPAFPPPALQLGVGAVGAADGAGPSPVRPRKRWLVRLRVARPRSQRAGAAARLA